MLENPHRLNVVRAVLNEPLRSMSQAKLDNIRQSLELLLHSKGSYKINILQIFPQENSGKDFNMLHTLAACMIRGSF